MSLVFMQRIDVFYYTSKLPIPIWDSKQGRDGGSKNANGVICQRQHAGATTHLLLHQMQFKYSYVGEMLHFKLFVRFM